MYGLLAAFSSPEFREHPSEEFSKNQTKVRLSMKHPRFTNKEQGNLGLSHKRDSRSNQRKEWASQVAAQDTNCIVRMTNLGAVTLQKFLSWSWDMSNAGSQRAQFHLVIQGSSLAVEQATML